LCSNVNIPWPTKGMGDGDYIFAFQQVVMPIAYEFDPHLVIGTFGPPLESNCADSVA
jgi:histone deacetylase 6